MEKTGNRTNQLSRITRRELIGTAAAATALTIVPRHILGQTAPSNLVNIAVVGSGGHGAFVVTQMLKAGGIKVVALCDVDAEFARHIETMEYGNRHITGLYRQFPNIPQYKDFRVMLAQKQNNIDAVVITTPEHTHVPASAMAMKMGKHVFSAKLLGHNILKDLDLPHEWPVAIHFVGSEGRLTMQIERGPAGPMELYPKAKFANYTPPPRTLGRSYGEYQQWIQAIRNNNPAGTEMPFSYSGPLCETLALGNVAYRTGQKLQWDAKNLKAINCPEADRFIRREYRKGWTL